ncbi:MAG TPA: hypothetical protein VGO93_12385 [Candidatus Xenobia bacterium]|jgi:hypothetical protein
MRQLRRLWLALILLCAVQAGTAQAAPTIASVLDGHGFTLTGNAVVCYCTGCSVINSTVTGNVVQGFSSCLALGPLATINGQLKMIGTCKVVNLVPGCAKGVSCKVTGGIVCGHECPPGNNCRWVSNHPCDHAVCNAVHCAQSAFRGLTACGGSVCLSRTGATFQLCGHHDGTTKVFCTNQVCLAGSVLTLCGGSACNLIFLVRGAGNDFNVSTSIIQLCGGLTPCDVLFCVQGCNACITSSTIDGTYMFCGCHHVTDTVDPSTVNGEIIGSGLNLVAGSFIIGPASTGAPELDTTSASGALAAILAALALVADRRTRRA